ncbi:hypothetical protein C2R22_03715 [Salinigranum rubrum]|uniref:Uncharacterized protein n=1 Tax=Salinigranum rubrum TaxID=755307 RepID=A0A2I8VG21_9EURY|nr:hypothetical protein [Salinigranum rubrum]AUV80876.1 hypothetical protein C2R22_03715 [Salinigranum rubrum]
MMEDTHIADGIAVKLLLACIVLTSGAVGIMGLAPATVHEDGSSGDHTAALAFPIDNVTATAETPLASIDGKGNDATQTAFPIDNISVEFPVDDMSRDVGDWDVRIHHLRGVTDATGATSQFRMQDMDPYALPRRSDGLPQDMDPY